MPNKINIMFARLQNSPYTGDLQTHHFSVAIRNNIAITPVMCNYNRFYVFGKKRGTMHAEMSSLNYLLNTDKSISCGPSHCVRLPNNILQSKGLC